MKIILGIALIWFAFSVVAAIVEKSFNPKVSILRCVVTGFAICSLMALLSAAVFYGVWLMGFPLPISPEITP